MRRFFLLLLLLLLLLANCTEQSEVTIKQ